MSLRASAALALGATMLLTLPAASGLGLPLVNSPPSATYLVGAEPGELGIASDAVRALGGNVTGTISEIDTLVVTMTPTVAQLLRTTSVAVAYIEPDIAARSAGAQWNGAQWDGAQWKGAQWDGAQWNGDATDPAIRNGWQWGLSSIGAPAAWRTEPGGRSASICVVDSGVDATHHDLTPHVTRAFSAVGDSSDVSDGGGHGTHVAGIASATHGDAWGIAGVTNSTILSAKVLKPDGTGTTSALASGLVWCAQNGADVTLMALSVDGKSRTIGRALDALASRGSVLIASAGNRGPCSECVSYPASDPRVLAVAATSPDGSLAPFSSTGPQVDLRAPGVSILSDLPGNSFAFGSGTSQAAAFAAGAAALLIEADPSLSADEVRSALVSGSRDGSLDVFGALAQVVPTEPAAAAASDEANGSEEDPMVSANATVTSGDSAAVELAADV